MDNIDQIIFSYLAGKTNMEEAQALRKWLNESKANKRQFDILKNYWENNHFEIHTTDGDVLFQRLKDKIRTSGTVSGNALKIQAEAKERYIHWYRLIGIAASLVLLATTGIYFFNAMSHAVPPVEAVATIIKKNPAGEKSRTILPDGSVAWLNSASSIRYTEHFSADKRVVDLQGEAYFEVAKDVQRPFVVRSGGLDVTALGTRFNVKSYAGDRNASVSLIDGKVRVDFAGKKTDSLKAIYLDPGQELTYNQLRHQANTASFDEEYVMAWKDGILALKDDTFPELKEKLERWYGVMINVEGTPPENFIVTGKFENEYLNNVLKTLQFGRDFNFAIHDDTVTIYFNQNPSAHAK